MAEKPQPQPQPAEQPLTSQVRTPPATSAADSPPAGESSTSGSTGQSGQGGRRGIGGIGLSSGESSGIRGSLSGPYLDPTFGTADPGGEPG